MLKKSLLCFLCLYLFLSIPGCKETPTAPSVPELILPTIEYFTASPISIILDDSSTLSWSTAGAATVSINPGIGAVSATGTKEVNPDMTTQYILTAQNSDGRKTSSCTVEIIKWAVLEYSTIPVTPVFTYDPIQDETTSDFVIFLTDIAGVGGQIDRIIIGHCPGISTQEFAGGTFDAFGGISCCCALVLSGEPVCVSVNWQGVDDNGYVIDEAIWLTLTWTSNIGSINSVRIVEGANHHKLIR